MDIDVPKLDVCKKTVTNHIRRLMDCGVITNYSFRGYQRASEIKISSEILVINEGITNTFKPAGYGDFEKGLPINTSSYSNKNKNKDNKAISKENAFDKEEFEAVNQAREVLWAEASNSDGSDAKASIFYRNNKVQAAKNFDTTNEKRKKVAPKKEKKRTIRTSFQTLLDKDIYQTAKALANHQYQDYHPLPAAHIETEAINGVLTRDEFRKILMLDFVFTAASLWTGKNVYVGEWINLLKYFNQTFLKYTHNDELQCFHKSTQVKRITEFRYRINWAKRYCKRNPGFNLLFPAAYFDENRKHSYEGGFGYTLKYHKKHLKNQEKKEEKDKQNKKLHVDREVKHLIKLQVIKYLNHEKTIDDLTAYVTKLEEKRHRKKNSLMPLTYELLQIEKARINQ